METINGVWYMKGCRRTDPECLHSPDDRLALVRQVGFLPLFSRRLLGAGFSNRSLEGGVELLPLFFLWFFSSSFVVSSAIFSVNAAICASFAARSSF